jgi:hypothetical protein
VLAAGFGVPTVLAVLKAVIFVAKHSSELPGLIHALGRNSPASFLPTGVNNVNVYRSIIEPRFASQAALILLYAVVLYNRS